MLTDLEAAYISGIIDGEGHISIEKHKQNWMYPSVRVCSTDRRIIDYLQQLLGGSIQTQAAGPRRRETFYWVFTGLERIGTLEPLVSRFSIIKKEQWELIEEFIHGRQVSKAFANQKLPEEEIIRRLDVKSRLQALTRRTFDA